MSSVVGGYPMSLANDMLITTARTFGGSEIEEMDRELTRMTEDFDRAVTVEALYRTRETDKRTRRPVSTYCPNAAILLNGPV